MRNLTLLGCVLATILSSGCQSGSYGFRNPFKDQFARTFPNSFPKLMTKSKNSEADNRGVYDLGGDTSADENAGLQSVTDSQGSADLSGSGRTSEVETMLEQGDSAYAEGDLQQAAGRYQEALSLDPQNVHAHHRLAIIHDQQHDYATAEQHYEAALKSEPENVMILNDLGYSYYLQRRYEDSAAHLEYILAIQPGDQLAMRNLALVRAAKGDIQQAYTLFQQGGVEPGESRQLIQQAVARAREGTATTRGNQMGIAATNSQPPGTSSVEGVATLASDNPADAGTKSSPSSPGRASTQLPRGDAFRPRPDLESAYGLSTQPSAGNPDPSRRPEASNGQYAFPHDDANSQLSLAHQEGPSNYAVERVSYSPPYSQQEAKEELIRIALNTGYGNLFPVISSEDCYPTQRDFAADYGTDARNAYYEQFGQPETSTPHVVHADSERPVNGGISQDRLRNVSYQETPASTYGSSRIQSPSDQSYQLGTEQPPVPANRFPVTQPAGQNYQPPDYSQFPRQEQPPFADPADSTGMSPTPGDESTGILIVPKSTEQPTAGRASTVNDQRKDWEIEYDRRMRTELGTNHSQFSERHQRQDNSNKYGASEVAPMSDDVQKAHDLALERYRRMQQQ